MASAGNARKGYKINPLLVLFAWDSFTAPTEEKDWLDKHEATTDRGWCYLQQHPDAERMDEDCCACVGNYVDYGPLGTHYREQADGAVHAVAYVFRYDELRKRSYVGLGWTWCSSPETAREWIEQQVRRYLEEEKR